MLNADCKTTLQSHSNHHSALLSHARISQPQTSRGAAADVVRRSDRSFAYAELDVKTNFSFLRGASHPDELVYRAAELGYRAIAVTDFNSLAGVVRAHEAAKEVGHQAADRRRD